MSQATPVAHEKLKELASALRQAEKTCVPIGPVSKLADLTIPDAYAIQLMNINDKLAEGQRITGKKIGLTSLAMQNLLGVNQPDFGHLLDSMAVKNNTIEIKTMVQPKVEGEIVFVLKKDLQGPGITVEDVLDATDYVAAAIEIVDSRVADWKINIIDTVSDNASSGMYVYSDKHVDPRTIDLKAVTMDLLRNGEKINSGKGTDVLGDPANCVAMLANQLAEFDVTLKAGEVILAGALSAMKAVEAGDVWTASFSELGECSVKFV